MDSNYYYEIKENGWLNEFIYDGKVVKLTNFQMKEIDITEKRKIGLIKYNDTEIHYFIGFEVEIRKRCPLNMLLYVKYETGQVFIVKHIS